MNPSIFSYNGEIERPVKREANKWCFSDVGTHCNGDTGVVFPSSKAGDVRFFHDNGIVGEGTKFIAFENGNYLKNGMGHFPKDWHSIARSEIQHGLSIAIGSASERNDTIIIGDASKFDLSSKYSNLDFANYDLTCSSFCLEDWWVKNHLNVFKVGADIMFTFTIGDFGDKMRIAIKERNGDAYHIKDISRNNDVAIENFGMDKDEWCESRCNAIANYLSNWMHVYKIAYYREGYVNSIEMACIHCMVERHFDAATDSALVSSKTKSKYNKAFFRQFEDEIERYVSKSNGTFEFDDLWRSIVSSRQDMPDECKEPRFIFKPCNRTSFLWCVKSIMKNNNKFDYQYIRKKREQGTMKICEKSVLPKFLNLNEM